MLVDISRRKDAEMQQRVPLNELSHRVKNNMQMLSSLLSSAARNARSPEAKQSLEEATAKISAMAAAQRTLYGPSRAGHFDRRAGASAGRESCIASGLMAPSSGGPGSWSR